MFGAVRSTVQVCTAGVGSRLPAASSARTSKVCAPSVRPVYGCGLEQSAKAPPSSRHSKPGPASEARNEKLAFAEFDATGGAEVTVVFAGVVSTVKRNEAGVASTLPATSIARTSNVYVFSASGPSVSGLVSVVQRAAVEPDLERRPRLGRAERERRRRVLRRRSGRAVERRARRDRVDPDGLREHAGVVADPVEGAVLDRGDALGRDVERARVDGAGEDRRVGAVGRVADLVEPRAGVGRGEGHGHGRRDVPAGRARRGVAEDARHRRRGVVGDVQRRHGRVRRRPGVARGDGVGEVPARAGGERERARDVGAADRGRHRLGTVRPAGLRDRRVRGRGGAGATVGDGAREREGAARGAVVVQRRAVQPGARGAAERDGVRRRGARPRR